MKATKAVKINGNMVGVEVLNIQDVVKAQAAGLKLVDKEGWEYSIYTIDDEETGEEREPTEQESSSTSPKTSQKARKCTHVWN